VPLDDVLDVISVQQQVEIQDLHDALTRLEQRHGQQAETVRRKFFCGQTHAEIAADLGCTLSRVEDGWYAARAWLRQQMKRD